MDLKIKKCAIIDLATKTFEVKSIDGLQNYMGGIALGLKLYEYYKDADPVVYSIGPLNGFFPFASKTCVVLNDDGVMEDLYLGGTLSSRLRFAGLDALVLTGKSEEQTVVDITNSKVSFKPADTKVEELGLPGRRCIMEVENGKINLNGYFTTPEKYLETKWADKNLKGIAVSGTETYTFQNFDMYKILYRRIIEMANRLTTEQNSYPSCGFCPRGCGKSKNGEIGGNILLHSLVACGFAQNIYTDIGIVFSCLDVLGCRYNHEDIEGLPKLVEETLAGLA